MSDARCEPAEKAFPDERTSEFPNIVNVEVFRGACPCRCVHCPVGRTDPGKREERFGRGAIDLSLYEQIVEEIALYPWATLRLHSVGEPILWNDLPEALRIARRNHVRMWLFTCGVTRDSSLLETICRSATVVEVSVNSIDRQDYTDTKGVDCFDLLMRNMRIMSRCRTGTGGARLLASRTQTDDPDADRKFVEFWRDSGLVDDAFVRSYHSYNGLLDEPDASGGVQPQPCLVHWARFNISASGRAIVCFNELFKPSLDPRLVLGEVGETDIASIWTGRKLSQLRRAALSGDYGRLDFGEALPCRECLSCQPLFGNRETSEHQIAELDNERD